MAVIILEDSPSSYCLLKNFSILLFRIRKYRNQPTELTREKIDLDTSEEVGKPRRTEGVSGHSYTFKAHINPNHTWGSQEVCGYVDRT